MPIGRTVLFASLLALIALAVLGSAQANAAGPAVIKMKLGKHGPFFAGDTSVGSGGTLEIKNTTDPNKIGPHTFSLVKRSQLPETRRQMKHCFRKGHICRDVANAHEFVPPNTINKPIVENGKIGWDKSFSAKRDGDSWYSDAQGQTHSRDVSARAGKTLYYMCVVHPEMQGKINVK
jgi:hypothetical protein